MSPDDYEKSGMGILSTATPVELAYALQAVETLVKEMGGTVTGDVQMTLEICPSVTFTLSFAGDTLRSYIARHPIKEAAAAIEHQGMRNTALQTG